MRSFLASIVVSLFLFTHAGAQDSSGLTDFSGKPRQLDEFIGQGKWLIVMFWAHDCHVCNHEAPGYQKFHNERKTRDAIVLGISIDGAERKKQAGEFIKRNGLSFTNLIGEPLQTTNMFSQLTGVEWLGTPTFLIYTPTGKLVAQQAGGVPVSLISEFIAEQTAAGNI